MKNVCSLKLPDLCKSAFPAIFSSKSCRAKRLTWDVSGCVNAPMRGVGRYCAFVLLAACVARADSFVVRGGHLFKQQGAKQQAVASELEVSDVRASYDAATVLISGRRASADHWQIFQLNADGSALRQVTKCAGDCRHGAYLGDGTIAFAVRENNAAYIAVVKPDGSAFGRITFGPGHFDLEGVLPDGRILVSKDQRLFCMRPDGTGLEAMYCERGCKGETGRTDWQRAELTAQPRPRILWSTLTPETGVGHLISLDSRISSADFGGTLKNAAHAVRVRTIDGNGSESVLGTAPVERDGSFFVAVPADAPVRFELLDESGKVLRAEKSWIWTRAGEERGCVGCHADRALAPQNHWPETLKRFDTPTPLMGGTHAK